MKINVYSVFDSKAAVFANPFYMANDAVALRGFAGAVNSPESMLYKHPEDYSLYRLGTFDDSVGLLVAEAQPVVMATASSCIKMVMPTTPAISPIEAAEKMAEKVHIAASVAK